MIVAAFVIFVALEVLSLATMPSVLLRRRGNPISASAWLVALVALPGLGCLLWLVFGRTRLARRTRRHAHAQERVSSHLGGMRSPETQLDVLIPKRARPRHAFSTLGNQVELLTDGQTAFPRLEEALRSAKRDIDMFYFAFEMDETGRGILDLLIEKSREGVTVRLLVDGLGSQKSVKEITKRIEGTGVQLGVFLPKKLRPLHLPRLNFVNHRKIVVIDDEVAFTGGMNIGDDYRLKWRDLMLVVRGPAVFWLNNTFLEDWFFATDELLEPPHRAGSPEMEEGVPLTVVTSGPSTEGWIEDSFFNAIVSAKKRVWITTPYLIPTAAIAHALRSAAGRGVDVRILIPRKSDVLIASWAARPYFRSMLRDGVRLFEHDGMVHGKALISDEYSAVGSANIDYRSMHLSFEICCFLRDEKVQDDLVEWIEDLFQNSREKVEDDLKRLSRKEVLLEAVAHLFSPLL